MITTWKTVTFVAVVSLFQLSNLACQRQTNKTDDMRTFSRELLKASKAGNTKVLVQEFSFMDMQYIQAAARRVGYPVPEREQVTKATDDAIAIFLRSYSDVFDGDFTCVAAREIDLRGIED